MVRKLLPRLGLLLGGFLAPLLVLELALRVLGPILPGNYEHGIWRVSHPVYGTFHLPGSTAWIRSPEFTVQVRFNSFGLRGPETTLQKRGGTRRVLLLGDSFVEAKQVPEVQGVSSRLTTLLNGPGRPPVEILNSGVSGWGPANEYLYLRSEGLAFEPDLVIVNFYVGNDISNNYPRSEREQRSLHEPAFSLTADGQLEQLAWTPRSVREGDASDALREHSLLFRAFETGVLDKLRYPLAGSDVEVNPRRLAIYQTREGPALSAAWQIVDALLGAIEAEVDRAGARMMLVIVPSKWQVHREDWQAFLKQNNLQQDDRWDLDRPNKRLMKIAERRGIPTLDLLPTLRAAASDGTRLYFPIDIHFTAEGHAVAARAMSEYIQAAGLPPVSGSAQR